MATISIAETKKQASEKMAKSIDTLKHDLAKVRTGRAHTGLLDHLRVDYYGTPTPIGQVANVTLVDSRTIGVQPYEKKMVQTIERAIRFQAQYEPGTNLRAWMYQILFSVFVTRCRRLRRTSCG